MKMNFLDTNDFQFTHCFDFSKYPGEARLKQFIRFYLEEKYQLEKKPVSDITEDVIEQVSHFIIIKLALIIVLTSKNFCVVLRF